MVRGPAFRYYGSKWRLAPVIIGLFPPHVCYVEPFGGSACVLLQKYPSALEVYNDADEQVVIFFRVLRERTEELIRAIELTPYARTELEVAFEACDDKLELARRFYVRSWQSRAGPSGNWRSGWRFQRTDASGKRVVGDWNDVEPLWAVAERLKQVMIECDDAFTVIGRYDAPETLFYLDPPYPKETRGRWAKGGYRHELDEADHRRLAELVHDLEGMVVLSSYPSALYDELYQDWQGVSREVRTEGNGRAMEVIWLSPAVDRARLPLFASL